MTYVDGFVLPVPKSKKAAYVRLAKIACRIWIEHGALTYVESVADDVKPGKVTSFPQSVKLKKGEAVWFSWITYKSRKHRDAVLAKVMQDKRMKAVMSPPFDMRRLIYGGFKVVVAK